MREIRTFVIEITTWFSFLVALWLFLFKVVSWEVPVILFVVSVVVFGLTTSKK